MRNPEQVAFEEGRSDTPRQLSGTHSDLGALYDDYTSGKVTTGARAEYSVVSLDEAARLKELTGYDINPGATHIVVDYSGLRHALKGTDLILWNCVPERSLLRERAYYQYQNL
ncbi:MAG: hypothetical protein ACOX1G_05095 [bacterium]